MNTYSAIFFNLYIKIFIAGKNIEIYRYCNTVVMSYLEPSDTCHITTPMPILNTCPDLVLIWDFGPILA